MVSAIWSMPSKEASKMPLKFFIKFRFMLRKLKSFDLHSKRILIRVDFNVPILDDVVVDDDVVKCIIIYYYLFIIMCCTWY